MEIKIVDSPELGDVQPENLVLYGNAVGRSWTKVNLTDEQEAKVRGNRFFAIKGEKKDPLDHDQNGKKGGSVSAAQAEAAAIAAAPSLQPQPEADKA